MIALMADKPTRKDGDRLDGERDGRYASFPRPKEIARRCLDYHLGRAPSEVDPEVLERLADRLHSPTNAQTWKVVDAGLPAVVVEILTSADIVLVRQLVRLTIDEFTELVSRVTGQDSDDLASLIETTIARMREIKIRFSPTKADRRAFSRIVVREFTSFGSSPAERMQRFHRYVYFLAIGKSMREIQGLTGLSTRSKKTHTAGGIAKAKLKEKIKEEWQRWESAENVALLMGFRRGCVGWGRITRYIGRVKRELELESKLAAECQTRQELTHRVRAELDREEQADQ